MSQWLGTNVVDEASAYMLRAVAETNPVGDVTSVDAHDAGSVRGYRVDHLRRRIAKVDRSGPEDLN